MVYFARFIRDPEGNGGAENKKFPRGIVGKSLFGILRSSSFRHIFPPAKSEILEIHKVFPRILCFAGRKIHSKIQRLEEYKQALRSNRQINIDVFTILCYNQNSKCCCFKPKRYFVKDNARE